MKSLLIIYILAHIQFISTDLNENNNEDFKCEIDTPLFDIESNLCVSTVFNISKHQISNYIIKTQWLNKMNQIGKKDNWYMGFDISSNGDLIIQSIKYNGGIVKKRNFYAIKSNGRDYFYDNYTNSFTNQIIIYSNTDYGKYESEFIKIKLIDEDNDYYLSSCIWDHTAEIIDFNKNEIFGVYQGLLFDQRRVVTERYNIIELSHNPKTYLFGTIITNYPTLTYDLYLQKMQFKKTNLYEEDSFIKLGNNLQNNNFNISNSKMISCIEIVKYALIQCFYIDISHYLTVGFFNEDNLNHIFSQTISENIIEDFVWDNSEYKYLGYYKCILLKDEISIFNYMIRKARRNFGLFLQIKQLIYDNKKDFYNFEDYLMGYKQINLNKDIIITDKSFYLFDTIRINNNKFSITFYEPSLNKIFIIIIQLYNTLNPSLFIKYYSINLELYGFKVYQFLKSVVYNNFLGLIYTTESNNGVYQYFSLFSYINSTDSVLNNINNEDKLNLSEYINTENIENNIFGVELKWIKIIKLPKSNMTGVYFLSSELNEQLIYENDILPINDYIIFVFDYVDIDPDDENIYTTEFAGIVQENNYYEDDKFVIYKEQYGNDSFENYYEQHIYIGKSSFYNFTINVVGTGSMDTTCSPNCKICYSEKCIKCEENYKLILNQNNCTNELYVEGYYYDEHNLVFKRCHNFCKTCSKGPKYYEDKLEFEDTNCNKCIQDYYKIENTNNCVNKNNTPLYHYFNTTEDKFIKCSENCLTCNQSHVNSTYYGCTSCDGHYIFYPESTNCLNWLSRNKYINPYFNECLDEIPEGYYLKDPINKLLDICYFFNFKKIKCLNDCIEYDLFADVENKKCFNSCLDNNETNKIYGFNYECYEDCPPGTKIDENRVGENICICEGLYYIKNKKMTCLSDDNCPEKYPLRKENSLECYGECRVIYKFECYTFCPERTFSFRVDDIEICLDFINDTNSSISLEELNLDEFSLFIGNNKSLNNNIVINYYEGISVNIYPNTIDIYDISQEYSNLTFIDLDKCEESPKKYYNLDQNQILYIISAEIKNPISNRLTNEFIFKVYLKNGTKLGNLSICNEKNTEFSVTLDLDKLDLINFNEAKELFDQGYNIYNLTSEFYTDNCSPAKLGTNDLALKDRILVYPKNVSFCPDRCNFFEVMIETKRVKCSCDVNYTEKYVNITNNFIKTNASDSFFIYLMDNLNYKVFKCYHIFLKIDYINLFKNIGFIFGVIVFLINLICLFIFTFYSLKRLRIQIYKSKPDEKNLKKYKLEDKEIEIIKEKRRKTFVIRKERIAENDIIFERRTSKRKTFTSRTNIMKGKHSLQTFSILRKKNEEYSFIKENNNKSNDNNNNIDYNSLTYVEALNKDQRNFFIIFMSVFKLKIDFIPIIFYSEEFSYKSYTISMYMFGLLFGFFSNSLLYTDDIVSEKYHNNGKLNILTSLFLSLTSNFISWLIGSLCKNFFIYNESLSLLVREVKRKYDYILTFKRLYIFIKLKSFCYFILSFLFIIIMNYYLVLFCTIYKESQNSLIINYIMGILESLITSIGISLVVSILRIIGLKTKNKYLYRTSIFLDQKL